MAAVTSGQVDAATNSVPAGATAIANGLPIKLITQTSITPKKGYINVLVKKDSPYKTFSGPRGQDRCDDQPAGPVPPTREERDRGRHPNSIPMSPADEPAALEAGRLDAIVMQDPTLTLAKQQYPDFRSLGNPTAKLPFALPSAGFYSSNDTISKKPAVLKQFVAAFKEAIALSGEEPGVGAADGPEVHGHDPGDRAKLVTLPVFDSRITPGSVGPMLLLMKKYGWIKNDPGVQLDRLAGIAPQPGCEWFRRPSWPPESPSDTEGVRWRR